MGIFSKKTSQPTQIVGILVLSLGVGLKEGDFVEAVYHDGELFIPGSHSYFNFKQEVYADQLDRYIKILPNNKITRKLYGQPSNIRQ